MDRYPRTPCRLPHKQLLDLSRLEHESRRYLYLGFAAGIIIHAIAGLFITYDGIVPARRPSAITAIPAELIELPPRVPNPYRDWRRRTIHRPYTRKPGASPSLPGLTLAEPHRLTPGPDHFAAVDGHTTSTLIDEQVTDAYTDSINTRDHDLMVHDNRIPLKNPLFSDTGDLMAELVFNPENKQAIQGYVHFAIGWGADLQPPDYLRQSIHHLAEALRVHTNIAATVDRQVYLAPILPEDFWEIYASLRTEQSRSNYKKEFYGTSEKLNLYPFLFMTTDRRFELTEHERRNLRRYLRGAGFMLFDNGAAGYDNGIIDKNIRMNILKTMRPENSGANVWFATLDQRHPLYHSFFDFTEGAPLSTENPSPSLPQKILGVFTGGGNQGPLKLVGIYTPQGYSRSWHDSRNTEQLKMGVNLVVYALTRYKEIAGKDGKGSELMSEQRFLRK